MEMWRDIELEIMPKTESAFESWTSLAVLVAVAAAILVLFTTYSNFTRPTRGRRLPPGPPHWPIIGTLSLRLKTDRPRHQELAELAKTYGPLYMLHLGSFKAVVVCSSRYAEEFLKTHDQVFASRRHNLFGSVVGYDSQAMGHSAYGPYWRHIRKVFTLEVLTAKRLQKFQELRKREVLCALQSILDETKGGKAVRIRQQFRDLTRNNITQMIINKNYFGPKSGASSMKDGESYITAMEKVTNMMATIVPEDVFPFLRHFDVFGIKKKLKIARKEVDQVLDRVIVEHRRKLASNEGTGAGHDTSDVIDALLTRAGVDAEEPMDDNQVKAVLLSIYIGGTETSSAAMEWTMAALLQNPPILKRVQDEIDSVVGRDRLVEESDLPRLEYLQAVVKESLRLHPVAPMLLPHYSTEDCEVGGYFIPKNCTVLVLVDSIMKDPARWERPLDFYPERFLTRSSASTPDLHGQHLDFIPFGSGRRICPGKNLGLLMVQYALAVLLHAADWKLPPGVRPDDIDFAVEPGSLSVPATPFEAVATPRLPLDLSVVLANGETTSVENNGM